MNVIIQLHLRFLFQDVKPNQIRCGEHSDYGSITLLFQDDVGGLQVEYLPNVTHLMEYLNTYDQAESHLKESFKLVPNLSYFLVYTVSKL